MREELKSQIASPLFGLVVAGICTAGSVALALLGVIQFWLGLCLLLITLTAIGVCSWKLDTGHSSKTKLAIVSLVELMIIALLYVPLMNRYEQQAHEGELPLAIAKEVARLMPHPATQDRPVITDPLAIAPPVSPSSIQYRGVLPFLHTIHQFVVVASLTCSLKPGTARPSTTVDLLPSGGGTADIEGSEGQFKVPFHSPIALRHLNDGMVVVVNAFLAPPTSGLLTQPLEGVRRFTKLTIPVTVGGVKSLRDIRSYEVLVIVNGRHWTYSKSVDPPEKFNGGPPFPTVMLAVPLDGLARQVLIDR